MCSRHSSATHIRASHSSPCRNASAHRHRSQCLCESFDIRWSRAITSCPILMDAILSQCQSLDRKSRRPIDSPLDSSLPGGSALRHDNHHKSPCMLCCRFHFYNVHSWPRSSAEGIASKKACIKQDYLHIPPCSETLVCHSGPAQEPVTIQTDMSELVIHVLGGYGAHGGYAFLCDAACSHNSVR